MTQFDFIDGLNELFDEPSTQQVVSRLIRHPLVWKFISEDQSHFDHIKSTRGNNPTNWSISGVLEAAADLGPQDVGSFNRNNPYQIKLIDLIDEKTEISSLSAVAFRITDQLKRESLDFSEFESRDLSFQEVLLWACVFSIVCHNSSDLNKLIDSFKDNDDDNFQRILAYVLYSDLTIRNFFEKNPDLLVQAGQISSLVKVISHLEELNDHVMAKTLSRNYLERNQVTIFTPSQDDEDFKSILDQINEIQDLMFLAEIADDSKAKKQLREINKNNLSKLLSWYGISTVDLESLDHSRKFVNSRSINPANQEIIERINSANNLLNTDRVSAVAFGKEIYQELIKKYQISKNFGLFLPKTQHALIQLFSKLDLTREFASLIEIFHKENPSDVEFLRVGANINHQYGNHQNAIKYFKLLSLLNSLNRTENTCYASSLEHIGDWEKAYEIRTKINFLSADDVKITLIDAYRSNKIEAINKIIQTNPFQIDQWPLIHLINDQSLTERILSKTEINYFKDEISNQVDFQWLLEILRDKGQNAALSELVDYKLNLKKNFIIISKTLLDYLLEINDKSSIIQWIDSYEIDNDLTQSQFEFLSTLYFEYGLDEKAIQLIDKFKNKWILSPINNILEIKSAISRGNYKSARENFSFRSNNENTEENLILLHAYSLLEKDPNDFPVNLEKSDREKFADYLELFNNYEQFQILELRIFGIFLNETERIEKILYEIERTIDHEPNIKWKLEAALANEYFDSGRYDLAIHHFSNVERVKSTNQDLLKKLLACHLHLKLISEAEKYLQKLLSIDKLESRDLVELDSYIIPINEWSTLISSQDIRLPERWEIKLLKALDSLRNGQIEQAIESNRKFFFLTAGDSDNSLLAAQIFAKAGDNTEAVRALDVLFSNSANLKSNHYLAGSVIHSQLGNLERAIILLNHLQPLGKSLTAYKLKLLLDNNQNDTAWKILQDFDSSQVETTDEIGELALINNKELSAFLTDPKSFEKIAAEVSFSKQDLKLAASFLIEGLTNDNEIVQLALLLNEISRLDDQRQIQSDLLDRFKNEDIHSILLLVTLGETALDFNEEILAANYLSNCIKIDPNNLRVQGLQVRMQKRNGNLEDAKSLYKNMLLNLNYETENIFQQNNSKILSNRFWIASLAKEMEDFPRSIEIIDQEFNRFGFLSGLVRLYISTSIDFLRQNFIHEKVGCNGKNGHLISRIRQRLTELGVWESQDGRSPELEMKLAICRAYLDGDVSGLSQVLNADQLMVDQKDRLFSSYLLNGIEKTLIDFSPALQTNEELFFLASLLVDTLPERSLELIRSFASLNSANPYHLALLAKIFQGMGNFEDAYAAVSMALEFLPGESGLEKLAGEISQLKGDLFAAVEHLKRAGIEEFVNNNSIEYADLILRSDPEKTLAVYNSVLITEPENFELTLKSADLALRLKRYGKSSILFESARKLNPIDPKPLIGLACVSENLGDNKKALEYLELGLGTCPGSLDLILRKSEILERLMNPQSAENFLNEQALKFEDLRPELQSKLATMIYKYDGVDKSLAYLASLTDNDAETIPLMLIKSKYMLLSGDYERAKELAESVFSRNPNESKVNALLGEICRFQGDLDQAVGYFLRAITFEPSDDQLFLSLFDIYNDRRDFQSAKETLEKGMLANPFSELLANRLARFLIQYGLYKQASDLIQQSIKLNPGNEELSMLQQEFNYLSDDFNTESQKIVE